MVVCCLVGSDGGQNLLEIFMMIVLSPQLLLEVLILHFAQNLSYNLILLSIESTLEMGQTPIIAFFFANIKFTLECFGSYS